MELMTIATLVGIPLSIVGMVWIIEKKFEKRLNETENRFERSLNEVEKRLQAGITENRNLIIKYIAKK